MRREYEKIYSDPDVDGIIDRIWLIGTNASMPVLYIDSHIRVFDNMYAKRLRTYKRIGFELITNGILAKQNVNAIYDSGSYTDVFEQDIVESYSRI